MPYVSNHLVLNSFFNSPFCIVNRRLMKQAMFWNTNKKIRIWNQCSCSGCKLWTWAWQAGFRICFYGRTRWLNWKVQEWGNSFGARALEMVRWIWCLARYVDTDSVRCCLRKCNTGWKYPWYGCKLLFLTHVNCDKCVADCSTNLAVVAFETVVVWCQPQMLQIHCRLSALFCHNVCTWAGTRQ